MHINSDFLSLRIDFLRKLLFGQHVVPISQYEVESLNRADDLRYIDKLHQNNGHGTLLFLLIRLDGLVKTVDAVMFLLDVAENANDEGLEIALESLEGAVEDNLVLNADNLIEVFKDCANGDMAPSLMINIVGEEKKEEIRPEPIIKKSSLNLDAMRDFK